jgi:RIO kinase 2
LSDIPSPSQTLELLLDFMDRAWKEGGFIHGDLSEHNIIMRHDNAQPVVIDFPQAVPITAQNAIELLERDINNILTYFSRKYGLQSDAAKVREIIIGH